MKKVVLYIGHHKVGSTSLQAFLSQNWLRLLQSGILYPSVETQGFAENLRRAMASCDEKDFLPVNVREPHSALAYRMMSEISTRKVPRQFKQLPASAQMFHALRNQVDALQPDTIILCSEVFSNFGGVDAALVSRLCGLFPDAEFVVYCALRRPDDYLISWHGQRLKVGRAPDRLADGGVRQYFSTIHFDYRSVVEPWAERVPSAKLIVRNYADVVANGGSETDFLQHAEIRVPDGMIPAGRTNPSLPRAAMEIVRQGNSDLQQGSARALARFFLSRDTGLEPCPNSKVEMFGEALRAEMAEAFQPVHDYLCSLTGARAFFPDMEELARPRPVPEADAARQLAAQIDQAVLPDDATRDFMEKFRQNF